jgi:hypothetical protein
VQGWGDSFVNGGLVLNPITSSTSRVYGTNDWLKVKGKLSTITADLAPFGSNESGYYNDIGMPFLSQAKYKGDYGIKVGIAKVDNSFETGCSYTGTEVNGIILCTVHRRNQGAMHVVFNPNGSKAFLNTDGITPAYWYNTDQVITSIADCFDV